MKFKSNPKLSLEKRIVLMMATMLLFVGCTSHVQLFETKSTNSILENGLFVYETDTIKITYAFWADKGIISFSIYNKLENPIYIDWKKSAFIDNSNKLNYWVDEEINTSISYNANYFYNGPLLKAGYSISEGVGMEVSKKLKAERITFIPPKSDYFRSDYYLFPYSSYEFDIDTESTEEVRNDNQSKKTIIYINNYSRKNSPLIFRNFLTISKNENFYDEFHIDNEFYLSSIREMDIRHFECKIKNGRGNYNQVYYYENPTSFYLYIPVEESMKYRKKLGSFFNQNSN